MKITEKIRIFLEKLQNLPDDKKKLILWTTVGVLAIIMGFFWVKGAINSFSKIGSEMQNIKIPQFDVPDMPAIDLQGIEDQIKQTTSPSDK